MKITNVYHHKEFSYENSKVCRDSISVDTKNVKNWKKIILGPGAVTTLKQTKLEKENAIQKKELKFRIKIKMFTENTQQAVGIIIPLNDIFAGEEFNSPNEESRMLEFKCEFCNTVIKNIQLIPLEVTDKNIHKLIGKTGTLKGCKQKNESFDIEFSNNLILLVWKADLFTEEFNATIKIVPKKLT